MHSISINYHAMGYDSEDCICCLGYGNVMAETNVMMCFGCIDSILKYDTHKTLSCVQGKMVSLENCDVCKEFKGFLAKLPVCQAHANSYAQNSGSSIARENDSENESDNEN